jgi:NADH-quinone oxidoreductase subunit L
MFRMWFTTFKGKPKEASEHCHGESSKSMTIPLVILSVFAFGSGFLLFLGLNDIITFSVIGGEFFVGGNGKTAEYLFWHVLENKWTYVSLALSLSGILLAYLMYSRRAINPARFNSDGRSGMYRILTARYFFPQLYDQISLKLGYGVAKGVDYIDRNLIDGTVDGISNAISGSSDTMRKMQTGYVRNYAAIVIVGTMALIVILYILVRTGGV